MSTLRALFRSSRSRSGASPSGGVRRALRARAARVSTALLISVMVASIMPASVFAGIPQTFTWGGFPTYKYWGDADFVFAAVPDDHTATVVFSSGGTCEVTATGNLTARIHITSRGLCTINAYVPGGGGYESALDTKSFPIYPASQYIDFPSLKVEVGSNVHLVATSKDARGTATGLPVSFETAAGAHCNVYQDYYRVWQVEGITGGDCTVKATQAGDINYNSAETLQVITVVKHDQTITFPTISNKLPGSDFWLSVSASSGLTVSLAPSGGCELVGLHVYVTAANGSCTITASQGGNGYYERAPNVVRTFDIAKADQTITFPTPWNKATDEADFSLSTSAGSSSGRPLTFNVAAPSQYTGTPSQCTVVGWDTLHLTGNVGSCTVTASRPEDAQYKQATPVTQSFYVGYVRGKIKEVALNQLALYRYDCGHWCGSNWCAKWAKWVWSTAGVPDQLGLERLNSWAHSFYDYGTTYGTYWTVPHVGDAVVFLGHGTGIDATAQASTWDKEGDPNVGIQHVALVTGVDPATKTFTSIGGNQGGLVTPNGAYSWTVGAWASTNGREGQYAKGQQGNGAGTFKIGGFISPVRIDRFPTSRRTYLMQTGDSATGSFAVASSAGETAKVGITVGPFFSDVDLTLHRPDGTLVSPSDPGVTFTKSANSIEVSITGAQPGVWTYEIHAVALEDGGEDIQFAVESTPVMTAFVGQDSQESQYLQPATFTATLRSADGVSIPPGSVQFNLDGNPVGSPVALDSAGQASWTTSDLSIGSYVVSVEYLGSDPFVAHTSAPVTHVVTRADQAIDFGALAGKTYGDADFGVSATASSGLAVSFAAAGDCTVSGTTVHIVGAGSCTITASQAGDGNYNPAPDVAQSFDIAKKALTITADDATKLYGQTLSFAGTELSVAGLVAGDGVSSVTLTSAGQSAGAQPGSYEIVPSAALGTRLSNYDIAYRNGTLTVNLVAIVGLDSVSITGSEVFDAVPNGGVFVVSNGSITITGSAAIRGDVRSTQGSVGLTGSTVVTGDVFAGTTIASVSRIRGLASPNSPVPALIAPAVAACSPYGSAAGLSGSYTYDPATGNLTVSGSKTLTIASGSYCFGSISLSGSAKLVVSGPVTIRLTGKFSVSGSAAINSTGNAASLQISTSYAGSNGVVISGSGVAHLTMYAPAAQVVISGSAEIAGLLLGKSVSVSGSAAIHQDSSAVGVWAGYYRN